MATADPKSSNHGIWALFAASLAVATGAYQLLPTVRAGATWAFITVTAGAFALGGAIWALVRQRKAPGSIWPAWPAALMAGATLAAGAAGAASLRQKTDELNVFVDKAFSGPDKDAEHAAIQTAYFRYLGYSSGRVCAVLGLGLGALSAVLALAALERARRAQKRAQSTQPGGGARFWLTTCGVVVAAAAAADLAAVQRAVPMAEDPEIAEPALIERRFAQGDVAGACRVLEPAMESSAAQAEALGRRLPDLADKARRCVDWELQRARKLGPSGCESVGSLIAPMRFVQVAGKQEAVAAACPSTEEPAK